MNAPIVVAWILLVVVIVWVAVMTAELALTRTQNLPPRATTHNEDNDDMIFQTAEEAQRDFS